MKLVIRTTMPDASQWDVPANLVAQNRAWHLARRDTGQESGEIYERHYKQELEYGMSSAADLIDWASNNMNWDDVASSATMHQPRRVDFQEGWVNGAKQVIETY